MDIGPFKSLIEERCGLTFRTDTDRDLEKALAMRREATGASTLKDYLYKVWNSEGEFLNLVDLLTINETYFWREPEHFRILVKRILPALLESRLQGCKVRLLSAGCSTGEEAYSMAMAVLEEFGKEAAESVMIAGFDIDSKALTTAKQGVYGKRSFRGFDEGLLEKYFEPAGQGRYRVNDEVRGCVDFYRQNLVAATYPEYLGAMDVIFYRNVSIYFASKTQSDILRRLSTLLSEDGYLIVSSAETFFHNVGIMTLTEMDKAFLYRKQVPLDMDDRRSLTGEMRRKPRAPAPAQAPAPTKASASASVAPGALPGRSPGRSPARAQARTQAQVKEPVRESAKRVDFDHAMALAREKDYGGALEAVTKYLVAEPDFIKGHTLKVALLLNLKRIGEARAACESIFSIDKWCLEGFLLSGLAALAEDDGEAAGKCFKEAVYVDPACWLAHFHLAELYNGRGASERALREYKVVVKLLGDGNGDATHGLTYFPLSFSTGQLLHLCRHNLDKLCN